VYGSDLRTRVHGPRSSGRPERGPLRVRGGGSTLTVTAARPLDAPRDDTITGHATLGPPRGMLLRSGAPAFQAECRGFETRLPLQFLLVAKGDRRPPRTCGTDAAARSDSQPGRAGSHLPYVDASHVQLRVSSYAGGHGSFGIVRFTRPVSRSNSCVLSTIGQRRTRRVAVC